MDPLTRHCSKEDTAVMLQGAKNAGHSRDTVDSPPATLKRKRSEETDISEPSQIPQGKPA